MLFDGGLGQSHDLRDVLHGLAVTNPFQGFSLAWSQILVLERDWKRQDFQVYQIVHQNNVVALLGPDLVKGILRQVCATTQRNRTLGAAGDGLKADGGI